MDEARDIFQLKVRLLGISPMIWRRVLIPADMTLRELHGVFQVAIGWESNHLYAFDIRAVQYGSFELMMADPRTPLAQFGFRRNDKFTYSYDMGDGWVHEARQDMHAMLDVLSEARKPDAGDDVVRSFLDDDVRMIMDCVLSRHSFCGAGAV